MERTEQEVWQKMDNKKAKKAKKTKLKPRSPPELGGNRKRPDQGLFRHFGTFLRKEKPVQ